MAAATEPDGGARHISPYSAREKVGRLAWAAVQGSLFRLSFPTWYGWRRWLLACFGAKLAADVRIRRTARFECPWNLSMGAGSSIGERAEIYCLGPVTIGARVTISQNAHLCAGSHDHSRADMPLLRPPIAVHDDAWVAADAFVGPRVTVGAGAILGARACAFKDIEPWTICGGNPARAIGERARPGGG